MPNLFSKKPSPLPAQPSAPDWAIHESQVLLYGAQKKAQNILAQAELEGIKVADSSKASLNQFQNQYLQHLDANTQSVEKIFEAKLEDLNKSYQKFLEDLKATSLAHQQAIDEAVKQRINEVLYNLEENIRTFLSQSQTKSSQAIELELQSVKNMIENYRASQFGLIDDNIVGILERTFTIVLQKKLTLEDQLDLVYDALEKAKAEKFFG